MFLALAGNYEEAAIILARKGADCTPVEQQQLGNKYTSFKQTIQAESFQNKAHQAFQAHQPTLPSTSSISHPQPVQPSQSPSQNSEQSAIIQENKQLKQELGESNNSATCFENDFELSANQHNQALQSLCKRI